MSFQYINIVTHPPKFIFINRVYSSIYHAFLYSSSLFNILSILPIFFHFIIFSCSTCSLIIYLVVHSSYICFSAPHIFGDIFLYTFFLYLGSYFSYIWYPISPIFGILFLLYLVSYFTYI